MIIIRTDQSE